MQCPYCVADMSKGRVGGAFGLYLGFTPEKAKLKIKYFLGAESLSFGKGGCGEQAVAHRCEKCNKIIIDLEDEIDYDYWKMILLEFYKGLECVRMINLEEKYGLPFCKVIITHKGKRLELDNVLIDTGSGGTSLRMARHGS